MRVMNISPGPRGLHVIGGTILLQPGEAREVEISEVEEQNARNTGNFHFGAGKPPASTEAQLRERFAAISSLQQAEQWPIEDVKRRLQERGMLW